MLKIRDIIDNCFKTEEEKLKYGNMLRQISIPDFYKCIAQFSGLSVDKVSDDSMMVYLSTWCRNKYRFFEMLGNRVRLDVPFEYTRGAVNVADELLDLGKEYPAYYLWLDMFKRQTSNKIEVERWSSVYCTVEQLFPQYNLIGSSLTHFFKSKLNAPDDLVTKIGALYEYKSINAKYTISINPVDMMLASENPYKWTSCYQLELRDDSHADGCLAAILDDTSLITYVWSNSGEYILHDNYKFKNIRYYRMRTWIVISHDFSAVHFNKTYPKDDVDTDLSKKYRGVVEKVISDFKGVEDKWKKNPTVELYDEESGWKAQRNLFDCTRVFEYGYSEFYGDYIYINPALCSVPLVERMSLEEYRKLGKQRELAVYNESIICPDGCGNDLPDEIKYQDENLGYNGEGFCAENFEFRGIYCEYCDEYCTSSDEWDGPGCLGCQFYDEHHPICDLVEDECPYPDPDYTEGGTMRAGEDHCAGCRFWEQCQEKPDEEEDIVE